MELELTAGLDTARNPSAVSKGIALAENQTVFYKGAMKNLRRSQISPIAPARTTLSQLFVTDEGTPIVLADKNDATADMPHCRLVAENGSAGKIFGAISPLGVSPLRKIEGDFFFDDGSNTPRALFKSEVVKKCGATATTFDIISRDFDTEELDALETDFLFQCFCTDRLDHEAAPKRYEVLVFGTFDNNKKKNLESATLWWRESPTSEWQSENYLATNNKHFCDFLFALTTSSEIFCFRAEVKKQDATQDCPGFLFVAQNNKIFYVKNDITFTPQISVADSDDKRQHGITFDKEFYPGSGFFLQAVIPSYNMRCFFPAKFAYYDEKNDQVVCFHWPTFDPDRTTSFRPINFATTFRWDESQGFYVETPVQAIGQPESRYEGERPRFCGKYFSALKQTVRYNTQSLFQSIMTAVFADTDRAETALNPPGIGVFDNDLEANHTNETWTGLQVESLSDIQAFDISPLFHKYFRAVYSENTFMGLSFIPEGDGEFAGSFITPVADFSDFQFSTQTRLAFGIELPKWILVRRENGEAFWFAVTEARIGGSCYGFDQIISRLASGLYKINTVSRENILVERNGTLELQQGGIDWMGGFSLDRFVNASEITKLSETKSFSVGSAFNPNFEASGVKGIGYVAPVKIYNANIDLRRAIKNGQVKFRGARGAKIDVFCSESAGTTSPEYCASFSGALPQNDPLLEGTLYPAPDASQISLPFPPNATSSPCAQDDFIGSFGDRAAVSMTFDNEALAGYFVQNSVRCEAPFVLFGQKYVHDGKNIYLCQMEGGTIQSLSLVAPSLGMLFLGASPTAAFFYSATENAICAFTGDRVMQKAYDISAEEMPATAGGYDIATGTLFLIAGTNYYLMRDGRTSRIPYSLISPTPATVLLPTKSGMYFFGGTNIAFSFLFREYAGNPASGFLPFLWRTVFIGEGADVLLSCTEFHVRLRYVKQSASETEKQPITVSLKVDCLSEFSKFQADGKTVEIPPSDWDEADTCAIRMQPRWQKGIAYAYEIASDCAIEVLDANAAVSPIGKSMVAGRRSV